MPTHVHPSTCFILIFVIKVAKQRVCSLSQQNSPDDCCRRPCNTLYYLNAFTKSISRNGRLFVRPNKFFCINNCRSTGLRNKAAEFGMNAKLLASISNSVVVFHNMCDVTWHTKRNFSICTCYLGKRDPSAFLLCFPLEIP